MWHFGISLECFFLLTRNLIHRMQRIVANCKHAQNNLIIFKLKALSAFRILNWMKLMISPVSLHCVHSKFSWNSIEIENYILKCIFEKKTKIRLRVKDPNIAQITLCLNSKKKFKFDLLNLDTVKRLNNVLSFSFFYRLAWAFSQLETPPSAVDVWF